MLVYESSGQEEIDWESLKKVDNKINKQKNNNKCGVISKGDFISGFQLVGATHR